MKRNEITEKYLDIVVAAKDAGKLRAGERENYVTVMVEEIREEFDAVIQDGTDAKLAEVCESILDEIRILLPENALNNELTTIQFICDREVFGAKWSILTKLQKYATFWTEPLDTWGKTASAAELAFEQDLISKNQAAFDALIKRDSKDLENFQMIAKLAMKVVKHNEKKGK